MTISVAVEVPFAGESAPAGEDSEGDDLALAEGGFRTWALFRRLGVAKVVNHDIKCGEEGVHIDHESVPFPSGSGSRPTLERGYLPLKFRTDNSHQAFKPLRTVTQHCRPGLGNPTDPEEATLRALQPTSKRG
jgi:hypothetical protein